MPSSYRIVRRTDSYTLLDCGDHYEVQRLNGERIVLEDVGRPGEPGQPGPPGPPGPAPSDAIIQAALDAWEVGHPSSYTWTSDTPVAVVDFDHPLPFQPNVRLTDTANTVYVVQPIITGQHVHIDLGGVVMSVVVHLS